MTLARALRRSTPPVLAALALTASGQGSSPPVLTLERAIEIAEAQNRQLGAADARLAAATASVDEARAARLPRLDLDAGYQRTDHPVLVFGDLLRQGRFGPENFDIELLNRPDPLANWNLRLVVEQPLWTGGRIEKGEELARRQRDATVAHRERTRQEVVRQVIDAYSTAVLAERRLVVAREALATAGAHVRWTDDLYRGGLVVESDPLLAQVRESEVRETVIRAESDVEIRRAALNLALGRDLGTPFSLPADLEPESQAGPDAGQLEVYLERAQERRPDLAAAHQQQAAAASRVGLERAATRPHLGVGASWETNSESFLDGGEDHWALSLGARLPLFNAASRARVDRARRLADEAGLHGELLAQSVALEVRQAWAELRAARQRIEQAAKGAALARRSLTIVEDRYREGLATLPELLDAETALTAARLREVMAKRDVLLARASLELASGGL